MSRLLSELLGAKEPMFSMALKQLEEITSKQGIDVSLTAEIITKIKTKIKELNLDDLDTTPKEFYHALLGRIKEDDERFCEYLGVRTRERTSFITEPVLKAVETAELPKKCWVIKKSVAKELLKNTPPKNIMKILRYKSIDSMLKNENILELYAALRFAESPEWLTAYNQKYTKLTPSDFEIRNIEILIMAEERWAEVSKQFTAKKIHFVTHSKEMGLVAVLPETDENNYGYATLLALLLFYYINEIRAYSSFFKLQQVKPDFAKILVETLNNDTTKVAQLAGQNIHWRIIQRYWGKIENKYHPELFEPHVQPEDLHWRKAEESISKIDPGFSWWDSTDYVGLNNKGPIVSLNMMDVVLNYYLKLNYESSYSQHMKDSLWNELFSRYMGEKVLEQQVLRQLDNDMIAPDSIYNSLKPRTI